MKSDTLFQPGEAEALVMRLREHLRDNADQQAGEVLEILLMRLAPRFERYAQGNFGGRSRETREDATREMIFQVCRGLRDLSSRAGAKCFETHFNVAVERCLYDAIRKIWRDENARGREQPFSSLPSGNTDDREQDASEQFADEDALQAIEQIVDATALQQLIGELPSPRHVLVLGWRLRGATWDNIAVQLQISEKTARNDFDSIKPMLKRFLLST